MEQSIFPAGKSTGLLDEPAPHLLFLSTISQVFCFISSDAALPFLFPRALVHAKFHTYFPPHFLQPVLLSTQIWFTLVDTKSVSQKRNTEINI